MYPAIALETLCFERASFFLISRRLPHHARSDPALSVRLRFEMNDGVIIERPRHVLRSASNSSGRVSVVLQRCACVACGRVRYRGFGLTRFVCSCAGPFRQNWTQVSLADCAFTFGVSSLLWCQMADPFLGVIRTILPLKMQFARVMDVGWKYAVRATGVSHLHR